MKRIFLVLAIIFIVALTGGTIYWYFVLSKQPTSEITPGTTAKPSPGAGFGSLRPYAYLCANFQKVDYKINCEKAVELALAQAPGKVRKVSIGSVRIFTPSQSGPRERHIVEMWLIDIELTSPYFDKTFQKEIHALQIGIRLDNTNGIYKKPLE